jgi:hypothetical protein
MTAKTLESERIEIYRHVLMTGRQVILKLHQTAKHPDFDLSQAARKLTLKMRDRMLLFIGSEEMPALMDFFFHEMRYRGRRIVDVLAESGADLTEDEREVLNARRVARCSLFSIVSVDPDACLVRLRDQLDSAASESDMTDINLSKSPIALGDLLFTRLVTCRGIHMGGGILFPFAAVHRLHLLNSYFERMRTVPDKERSLRSYVFFFRKCREIGIRHAYEENV